jgi:hypothetical protein
MGFFSPQLSRTALVYRRIKRPPGVDDHHQRIAELERETRRLWAKLEQTEAVIEIQKKASMLLGIPLKSPDDEGND